MSTILQKHSRVPRKWHPQKDVKSTRGTFAPISIERRQEILEDAKREILNGTALHLIAKKHGIAPRTLSYWLASLGDEYDELRRAWLDGMLNDAGELLEGADDPMQLARARELWKRATWYAERRDRARYGEQRDFNLTVNIGDLGDRLRRARERVVDAQQVIDAAPLPTVVGNASDESA